MSQGVGRDRKRGAGARRNEGPAAKPLKIGGVPLPLPQTPVRDQIHLGAVHGRANAIRLVDAPRPVAFWHLASLDAPTVAVTWSLAFAWAGEVRLAGRVLLVLALAVWCAYVCDRLLDARRGLQSLKDSTQAELRERHFFHWRHRRLLAPMAAAAACVAGVTAVTLLPSIVRERGLAVAAAALVYFSGVHAAPRVQRGRHSLPKPLSKELLVAVLFTAGCILPAWTHLQASASLELSRLWFWIAAAYFAGLAWINCRSIARWESYDESGGARFELERRLERIGQRTNLFAALIVAFAGLLLAMIADGSHARAAALLLAGAASALLLALLDRMQTRMTPLALRAAADLVLLTPILLFIR